MRRLMGTAREGPCLLSSAARAGRHFDADESPPPPAEERAIEVRYGPETALVENAGIHSIDDSQHEVRMRSLAGRRTVSTGARWNVIINDSPPSRCARFAALATRDTSCARSRS
jgi:hypothetical protein